MRTFWDLLHESTILSGFIVLTCVGSVCYLAVTGKTIPDILINISMIIVGFFFGTKSTIRDNDLISRVRE